MEHQTLGCWVIYPSDPANQCTYYIEDCQIYDLNENVDQQGRNISKFGLILRVDMTVKETFMQDTSSYP